jgi:hypothetical protein
LLDTQPIASCSRVSGSASPTVSGARSHRTSGCGVSPITGKVIRSGEELKMLPENLLVSVRWSRA